VVFAGSVVRSNYEWNERIQSGQVERVLNFEATTDWVVAFFPRFFDFYNLQDLGGAGHVGFNDASKEGPVYSIKYAIGAHSAGKHEALWDDIAEFVLADKDAKLPPKLMQVANGHEDIENNLSPVRKNFGSILVSFISRINFVVYFALFTVLLAAIPALILNYLGPLLAGFIINISNLDINADWILFVLILLISTIWIATPIKYKRPYGVIKSFVGIFIVGAIVKLTVESFSRLTALPGDKNTISTAINTAPSITAINAGSLIAATTTVLMIAWFLALIWALRRI